MHKKNTPMPVLVLCALLLVAGCTPMVSNHGNMLKQAQIEEIKPETSTRMDVAEKWGPPSTSSAFDPNVWYYIGEQDSRKGVFAPKVDERKIIKVVFNGDDTVKEVSLLDNKTARDIQMVEDTTPTAGKEYTALQQFIGNLGKFNSNSAAKRSSPGG